MLVATILLFVATFAFVASHFLMSHAWRASLISAMGPNGFLTFYSFISVLLFAAVLIAFHFAQREQVLPVIPAVSAVANVITSILTLISLGLLFGSLFGNPALVGANTNGLSTHYPEGTFKVTRHPMMMGIAIWGIGHIIMSPSPRSLILDSGMIILAVYGSRLQDRKKVALTGREWNTWVNRTSFWPDVRQFPAIGKHWVTAVLAWLVITWLHLHFWGVPAGIWALFPEAI